MTEALVPFGSPAYFALLGGVLLARGMDFLSTWTATPHLMLEANPVARALGWRWGALLNGALAGLVALWPLPALIVITSSLLVAARNFQSAWLSRSLGEAEYRSWLGDRLSHAPRGLFVFCTAAQAVLVALVGGVLIVFSPATSVAFAVGLGILAYGGAVLIFPLFGAWSLWRQPEDKA